MNEEGGTCSGCGRSMVPLPADQKCPTCRRGGFGKPRYGRIKHKADRDYAAEWRRRRFAR